MLDHVTLPFEFKKWAILILGVFFVYCESTFIRGYQFSWIRVETQVCGSLNSWIGGFQCTHQRKSPFH